MGCCTSFSRFILFTINIICFLISLVMLILGILFQVNLAGFIEGFEELHGVVSLTPILLIVVGAIIFVISFLGCCGAIRRSSCMLITYAVFMIIILILQVAFVIYILVQARDDSGLKDNLYQALRALFASATGVATETVDFIQANLGCCGVTGPADWDWALPSSCCRTYINGLCVPYTQGCWTEFYELIRNSITIIGIVAGSLAAVELIAAIMAIWISNSGKKRGEYV